MVTKMVIILMSEFHCMLNKKKILNTPGHNNGPHLKEFHSIHNHDVERKVIPRVLRQNAFIDNALLRFALKLVL